MQIVASIRRSTFHLQRHFHPAVSYIQLYTDIDAAPSTRNRHLVRERTAERIIRHSQLMMPGGTGRLLMVLALPPYARLLKRMIDT